MSRGVEETERLKESISKQLNRLLMQLEDLEELRSELEDFEYEETRQETMRELEDFEAMLADPTMTLVSELNSVQLAIQGAIRQAFKTPEVIKMFAKREPDALRAKLQQHKEQKKLGRISEQAYTALASEILLALQKLGQPLSADETQLLEGENQFVANSDDVTRALSLVEE